MSGINKIISDIKSLKVQGARNVAKAGLRAMKAASEESKARSSEEFLRELSGVAEKLFRSRPTEPELRHSVKFIISSLSERASEQGAGKNAKDVKGAEKGAAKGAKASRPGSEVAALKKLASRLCNESLKDSRDSIKRLAEQGSRLIVDGDVVLTHCHSSSVVSVLLAAKKKRKKFSVIVTETRPRMQGIITAKELIKAKIPVEYVVDSAAAYVMKRVTKCLFGADAIMADGSIANKIGTYLMAIAADKFEVPVYIACGSHKFDSKTLLGFPEPIEIREAKEIIDPKSLKRAEIFNPAFDVTPPHYIKAVITEKGVFNPVTLATILAKEEEHYRAN